MLNYKVENAEKVKAQAEALRREVEAKFADVKRKVKGGASPADLIGGEFRLGKYRFYPFTAEHLIIFAIYMGEPEIMEAGSALENAGLVDVQVMLYLASLKDPSKARPRFVAGDVLTYAVYKGKKDLLTQLLDQDKLERWRMWLVNRAVKFCRKIPMSFYTSKAFYDLLAFLFGWQGAFDQGATKGDAVGGSKKK